MHNTANQAVDKKAAIELAAALIEQADAIIVAAGAGMGIDSGLPDFRGKDGFWRAYPALRHAGLDFYSIASPQAFHVSPEVAWGFTGIGWLCTVEQGRTVASRCSSAGGSGCHMVWPYSPATSMGNSRKQASILL